MAIRDRPNYPLRLPAELRKFLQTEADKHERSLNSEITRRLQATAEASAALNRLDEEDDETYAQRVLDALKYQALAHADSIEAAKQLLRNMTKKRKG